MAVIYIIRIAGSDKVISLITPFWVIVNFLILVFIIAFLWKHFKKK